jgi:hypothetical protein
MAKNKVTHSKVKKVVKKEVLATKKMAKLANKKASSNKKEVAKAKRIVKKEKAKNLKQDKDIEMLKAEIAKLKSKKVSRGRVSEYNLFIRKQIKSGMSFTKAAKQWSKYKALQEKNKRKPSAYNQFIGSQMRLGKTWAESVALWKLAKAGKLGKKGKTRTVTKTVVKTRVIKPKPKIKYRTRTLTKTIVKKVPQKPKTRTVTKIVKSGSDVDSKMLREMISSSMSRSISRDDISSMINPDDEEIAFKIIQTYFKEIARYGFKKQLTLDEIINAYFYALARVKRKNAPEAEKAVREAGITK